MRPPPPAEYTVVTVWSLLPFSVKKRIVCLLGNSSLFKSIAICVCNVCAYYCTTVFGDNWLLYVQHRTEDFCLSVGLDYYSPAMLGLKMDQEVLGELVKIKTPQVWRTMIDHNVMWTLVVSRWFICLYIDVLPVEVSVISYSIWQKKKTCFQNDQDLFKKTSWRTFYSHKDEL